MDFQVGDKVVHRIYGLGEIVQIDEKEISGHTDLYYVVLINDLSIWVPVNQTDPCSLRAPTPASEFELLFDLLSGPPEPLSDNRLERIKLLSDQLKGKSLKPVCRIIRDLNHLSQTKRLNESERDILRRAKAFLLTEWQFSLSTPMTQAKEELNLLLRNRLNG